jgi:iron(III) transport system permease protein
MARPLARPTPRVIPLDPADASAAAVLAMLAAFIGWPVAAVIVAGVAAPAAAPPLAVVLATVAVAGASTLLALLGGAALAYAVSRVNVPGRVLAWRVFRLGVLVPPFLAPLGLLVLAGSSGVPGSGGAPAGFVAIVIGQTLAFLPHATALLVRALADVPADLERAAEVLGASRLTVLRRVTLGVARPRLRAAALVVLGLCLADVATPLLLGGDALVLATFVVAAAAVNSDNAVGAALGLAALATPVALLGATWRHAAVASWGSARLPRLDRPAPALLRGSLGVTIWGAALALATLWAIVPLGSLLRAGDGAWRPSFEHWAALATPAAAAPLGSSAALGLGAGLAGTALALSAAWIVERGRPPVARAVAWLARVPVAAPGVVASLGYLLTFGASPPALAGTLLVLVAAVACWELPVTLALARAGLARSHPSAEEVAVSLGASRGIALRRIVVPALRPVAGWIFGHSLSAGVLAVGTVIVLAGPRLGATTLLALAASGAAGAACAVATVLLALAGGALLLGRAIAGRERVPTLLA